MASGICFLPFLLSGLEFELMMARLVPARFYSTLKPFQGDLCAGGHWFLSNLFCSSQIHEKTIQSPSRTIFCKPISSASPLSTQTNYIYHNTNGHKPPHHNHHHFANEFLSLSSITNTQILNQIPHLPRHQSCTAPAHVQIQSHCFTGQLGQTNTIAARPSYESLELPLLGFPLISICWLQLMPDLSLSSISPSLCPHLPVLGLPRPHKLSPRSI